VKRSLCRLVALCVSGLLAACGGSSGTNCGGGCSQLATHFSVTTPQDATVGAPFSFTVTALDSSNAVAPSYAGMVHFASTDSEAVLPANSTLANGTGTFSATFNTMGNQTITATDAVTLTIRGISNAIQVSIAPPVGRFTPTGSMAFARSGHTATLLTDGTVLVTGGSDAAGPLATAESFDPTTGMFRPAAGMMETARAGHTATLLTDGTVLVTGGSDATAALATAEIFDPTTGIFSPTAGMMETARSGQTATLLNDGSGRVLVAGGGPVSAELFDPNTGQFTPVNVDMLASMSTATLLPNGEVFLEGGGIAQGDLFSASTATFTATANGGPMALDLSAALLANGSVLLAGGEVTQPYYCMFGGLRGVSTSTAILFDSSSTTFSDTGEMKDSRFNHTATILNGGEVLIAGGTSITFKCDRGSPRYQTSVLASAELYNPASGTFAFTGSMSTARTGHIATLLRNGTVLVEGGADANGNALASAELFQ